MGPFVDADPVVTAPGDLCGLCDSSFGCSHPTMRCLGCWKEGLAENMTAERHSCRPDSVAWVRESKRRIRLAIFKYGPAGAAAHVSEPFVYWAVEIENVRTAK